VSDINRTSVVLLKHYTNKLYKMLHQGEKCTIVCVVPMERFTLFKPTLVGCGVVNNTGLKLIGSQVANIEYSWSLCRFAHITA